MMKILLSFVFVFVTCQASYAQVTFGPHSPSISGNNNTVIYGVYDLRSAISNFNSDSIKNYARMGNVKTFEAVFQEPGVARKFLELLKANGDQIVLDTLLQRGMDPNLLVKAPDGSNEAIVTSAFMSRNAEAIVIILSKGAYSHGYQEITLDQTAYPFFIYPIFRVLSDTKFTAIEKEKIVVAMLKQGVFLDGSSSSSKISKTTKQAADISKKYSIYNMSMIIDCPDQGENAKCVSVGQKCSVLEASPKKIYQKPGSFRYTEYENLDWVRQLGSFAGKKYYIYLAPQVWSSHVVLAEFSADSSSASLLKYQSNSMAGMGVCKSGSDGYVPSECWRSLEIEVERDTGTVSVFDSPDFVAEFCK